MKEYSRDSKKLTNSSQILLFLLNADYYYGRLATLGSMRNALYPETAKHYRDKRYASTLSKLKKKGLISYEYNEANNIIKLTSKGELEALFRKAKFESNEKAWDKKWRLILFDIPEDARPIRDRLRKLLKQFGFKALQASVYINPFPISEDGVEYLKRTKLNRYIRILRVDKIDDDSNLLKKFNL